MTGGGPSHGGGLVPSFLCGYVLVEPSGDLQYMSCGPFNPCEVCVSYPEKTQTGSKGEITYECVSRLH